MPIPKSFIQDLLARIDIVEIIQARVTLKKRGNSYLACCPFHQEKTPSFSVSQQKQFYYCFGCGATGNAIGFLMAFDRLEFPDAVKTLAAHVGVEVPTEAGQQPREDHSHLYTIMDQANQFYQQQLRESQQAINYLKGRGLTGTTAKTYGIGFATDHWDHLLTHLSHGDKDRQLLELAGLIINKPPKCYDRFRHRIMFPIRNTRGQVIAFGGRVIDSNEQPKYLNSPETPIFHKNQELYGLYEARQQNRKLETLIVAEGYMDVVSLAQHGITNAVACLGTAINVKHIQKLLRYAPTIVFCFDGDAAGRNAAWKALTLSMPLLRDGISLRFLFLPEGHDPDSLVREVGKDAFLARLNSAPALTDVFFEHLNAEHPIRSLDDKARFAKEASTHINAMPEGIFKSLLCDRLAQLVGIQSTELDKVLEPRPAPQAEAPHLVTGAILSPTQQAIVLLLKNPSLAQTVDDPQQLANKHLKERAFLIELIELFKTNPMPVGQLIAHYESPGIQKYITQLAARPCHLSPEALAQEFRGALQRLREHDKNFIINKLIEKSKIQTLTDAEKELLQSLIGLKVDKN